MSIASKEIKKRDTTNILPQRKSTYVKQQLRLDYSPLFNFLLSKVGLRWATSTAELKANFDPLPLIRKP
ncbi:hypothetical protein QVN83_20375 [Yersinia frederiksenii]|uniref:hypothetical protein n=1 Tax=Yersinia frederiksenii TaxID=29484 RepID=UPI0025AB09F3|nr:hypothetical protein [Yersinia frederiksenii]MDN0121303.1 hypothetical protein [Yersinia frederiksenii]